MSVTVIIFLTFVGLLVIGAPITLSLGAAAMGGMIFSGKPLEGLVEVLPGDKIRRVEES